MSPAPHVPNLGYGTRRVTASDKRRDRFERKPYRSDPRRERSAQPLTYLARRTSSTFVPAPRLGMDSP